MTIDKRNILIGLLVIVCVVFFLSLLKCCKRECSNTPSITDTITISDTIYDTITVTIHSKPVIHTITDWDTMWKYYPIDTQAILADYHRLYIYTDTLENDTLYYIVITDSITKNKIIGRELEYKCLKPMVITNTLITNIYEKHNKIGIGIYAGVSNLYPLIGIMGSYTKDKYVIDVGVGYKYDIRIGIKYNLFEWNKGE